MSFQSYYDGRVTWVDESVPRLDLMADLVVRELAARPAGPRPRVLDLGCGRGQLLGMLAPRTQADLTGLDAAPSVDAQGWTYVAGDLTARLPLADAGYDVVVAGEVIEHVPHPDALLREVRRVLRPGGVLVLSTPNLVCWANRVLVPLGVQPLFTETSSDVALGRRLRALGQGNEVQGHLKVFTARSLQEILDREGFAVRERHGTTFAFPGPLAAVDRLLSRRVTWASGLVYVAQREDAEPVRAPARPPRPLTPSRAPAGRRRR